MGFRKDYDYHPASQVRVRGESGLKPARWTLCFKKYGYTVNIVLILIKLEIDYGMDSTVKA